MCLIFFALNDHPEYALVLAANRDEFYSRPTAPAEFWEARPDILAGRDLQENTGQLPGTWLGVTKTGRIDMVTNYRDFRNIKTNTPSRGPLVTNFLSGNDSAEIYLKNLSKVASQYNGFNLLAGTVQELLYYSNQENQISILPPGIYGISNHLLDTPWPKVTRGKKNFLEILKNKSHFETDDFLDLMADRTICRDEDLPDTGVGITRERMLSPVFIESADYGTRCTTVILITKSGEVSFVEKTYKPIPGLNKFSFTISRKNG
jgi:uncharacterized protein with NRDE domain